MRKIKWASLGWAVWYLGVYFIPTPGGMHWVDWLLMAAIAWHLVPFVRSLPLCTGGQSE